ncbi:MAG: hypothetical protein HXY37_04215 [Chloroflexi bacterium]|nr:hypothetical protein [Chloroflexota bacterium]
MTVAPTRPDRIPVTVLTGFPGAGTTTVLNPILRLDACVHRTIGERVREACALLRHQLNARFKGGDHDVR